MHTAQVNFLLVSDSFLFSASNDKTIIKWPLEERSPSITFKRLSATALGHLGTVDSLAMCRITLFSASSDLTTRRWNTQTGNHEEVYFGLTKSITTVILYNGSVFSGSEDFSVLMLSPRLPPADEDKTSARALANTKITVRTVISFKSESFVSAAVLTVVLLGGIAALVLLVAIALIAFFYLSYTRKKRIIKFAPITQGIYDTTADIETVINTVVGIPKHAACLIETSVLASTKKIAVGGGGE
jgi:hypothetical protein